MTLMQICVNVIAIERQVAMTADPTTLAVLEAWRPYRKLVKGGMAGFEPFTAMAPWYLLRAADMFDANKAWPSGPADHVEPCLLVFGRRQDNDYLVCARIENQAINAVVLIEGWQQSAYAVLAEFSSLDDWMEVVLDDVDGF